MGRIQVAVLLLERVRRWFPNRIADGSLANPTISRWFEPSAFAQPATFTFGNSRGNVLRGPNWRTLDFSVGKNFGLSRMREAVQLRIRMDAVNILNHPVFANPSSRIGAAEWGPSRRR